MTKRNKPGSLTAAIRRLVASNPEISNKDLAAMLATEGFANVNISTLQTYAAKCRGALRAFVAVGWVPPPKKPEPTPLGSGVRGRATLH